MQDGWGVSRYGEFVAGMELHSRMERLQLGSVPGGRCSRGSGTVKLVLGYRKCVGMRSCTCRGVADIASSTMSMDWRPALDEILLMSSVLLAYVAGVVNRPLVVLPPGKKSARLVAENATVARSEEKVVNAGSAWDYVDKKLEEAVSSKEASSSSMVTSPSLFLQALAYGPRLRLLVSASKLLRNEIARRSSPMSLVEVCSMVGPICRCWIANESAREEEVPFGYVATRPKNTEAVDKAVEGEAEEYMLFCLQRSGKAKLYTDFLSFVCKQTLSPSRSFDGNSFVNFLEDIVITVSEAAAVLYLDGISAMSHGWPTLLHPSISSTRLLQKFRNEVSLQQWIHHNFDSVAAIYEDRLELWALKEKNNKEHTNKKTRSKKQTNDNVTAGELSLRRVNYRCRRNDELKALSGWRYWYSLYLEVSDIVGPVFRMLVTKLGQGLSFLLVCLIGRSFGLIYQGIRQSVKRSSD